MNRWAAPIGLLVTCCPSPVMRAPAERRRFLGRLRRRSRAPALPDGATDAIAFDVDGDGDRELVCFAPRTASQGLARSRSIHSPPRRSQRGPRRARRCAARASMSHSMTAPPGDRRQRHDHGPPSYALTPRFSTPRVAGIPGCWWRPAATTRISRSLLPDGLGRRARADFDGLRLVLDCSGRPADRWPTSTAMGPMNWSWSTT